MLLRLLLLLLLRLLLLLLLPLLLQARQSTCIKSVQLPASPRLYTFRTAYVSVTFENVRAKDNGAVLAMALRAVAMTTGGSLKGRGNSMTRSPAKSSMGSGGTGTCPPWLPTPPAAGGKEMGSQAIQETRTRMSRQGKTPPSMASTRILKPVALTDKVLAAKTKISSSSSSSPVSS